MSDTNHPCLVCQRYLCSTTAEGGHERLREREGDEYVPCRCRCHGDQR